MSRSEVVRKVKNYLLRESRSQDRDSSDWETNTAERYFVQTSV